MSKKYKSTRLPMTHRAMIAIRYNKRLQSTARRHKQLPRCSCCGSTKNLQSGWSGGNLIWLCPGAAYEANHPGM